MILNSGILINLLIHKVSKIILINKNYWKEKDKLKKI